jgi:Rrf2 family protein
MKLITRDIDYAVRALCRMARKPEDSCSASELVKLLGIPRPFLRKLLQKLNKSGILTSVKGKGGGFTLARKPGNIYISDVMRAFHGYIYINECSFRKGKCPNTGTCRLRREINSIERNAVSRLGKISIAYLAGV